MAILIDESKTVLVQGITGREGQARTRLMLEFGTKVVAGCTPGKGGGQVLGVPVFDTVSEARERVGCVDISVVFVPAALVKSAALEALAALAANSGTLSDADAFPTWLRVGLEHPHLAVRQRAVAASAALALKSDRGRYLIARMSQFDPDYSVQAEATRALSVLGERRQWWAIQDTWMYAQRKAAREPSEKNGGKPVRQAIDLALEWLAAHQSPDGRWSTQHFGDYRLDQESHLLGTKATQVLGPTELFAPSNVSRFYCTANVVTERGTREPPGASATVANRLLERAPDEDSSSHSGFPTDPQGPRLSPRQVLDRHTLANWVGRWAI